MVQTWVLSDGVDLGLVRWCRPGSCQMVQTWVLSDGVDLGLVRWCRPGSCQMVQTWVLSDGVDLGLVRVNCEDICEHLPVESYVLLLAQHKHLNSYKSHSSTSNLHAFLAEVREASHSQSLQEANGKICAWEQTYGRYEEDFDRDIIL